MAERPAALALETEDGVRFALPLAGPVVRLLAWLVDALAVLALSSTLAKALGLLAMASEDLAGAVQLLAFFAVSVGYSIALEWVLRGQTIGKRLFGLRVMDATGARLRPSQVVLRNLLRLADMLPLAYLAGGLACFFSRHGQRLGDLAANTVVVRSRAAPLPRLERVTAGLHGSLADHPRLLARLRQQVSPDEAALALDAVLRRDRLDPTPRLQVFAGLAEHFRRIVPFPEEATVGLSDEGYLRQVVAALFADPTRRALDPTRRAPDPTLRAPNEPPRDAGSPGASG